MWADWFLASPQALLAVVASTAAMYAAVLIFALGAMGTLFGTIGIVLAAPITVVVYTLVADLWSRETLGHEVDTLENAGIDDDSETASE